MQLNKNLKLHKTKSNVSSFILSINRCGTLTRTCYSPEPMVVVKRPLKSIFKILCTEWHVTSSTCPAVVCGSHRFTFSILQAFLLHGTSLLIILLETTWVESKDQMSPTRPNGWGKSRSQYSNLFHKAQLSY